jgi:hypothetical protein
LHHNIFEGNVVNRSTFSYGILKMCVSSTRVTVPDQILVNQPVKIKASGSGKTENVLLCILKGVKVMHDYSNGASRTP